METFYGQIITIHYSGGFLQLKRLLIFLCERVLVHCPNAINFPQSSRLCCKRSSCLTLMSRVLLRKPALPRIDQILRQYSNPTRGMPLSNQSLISMTRSRSVLTCGLCYRCPSRGTANLGSHIFSFSCKYSFQVLTCTKMDSIN